MTTKERLKATEDVTGLEFKYEDANRFVFNGDKQWYLFVYKQGGIGYSVSSESEVVAKLTALPIKWLKPLGEIGGDEYGGWKKRD